MNASIDWISARPSQQCTDQYGLMPRLDWQDAVIQYAAMQGCAMHCDAVKLISAIGSLPYGCWKHVAKALIAIAFGSTFVPDSCLNDTPCAENITQNCHNVPEHHAGTKAAAVHAPKGDLLTTGCSLICPHSVTHFHCSSRC